MKEESSEGSSDDGDNRVVDEMLLIEEAANEGTGTVTPEILDQN